MTAQKEVALRSRMPHARVLTKCATWLIDISNPENAVARFLPSKYCLIPNPSTCPEKSSNYAHSEQMPRSPRVKVSLNAISEIFNVFIVYSVAHVSWKRVAVPAR
jgi:hypothetical protein